MRVLDVPLVHVDKYWKKLLFLCQGKASKISGYGDPVLFVEYGAAILSLSHS